jgi:hypothetical protein
MLLRKRRYDVALETVGFFSYPRWLALETRAHRCVAARPAAIPGKPLAVQDTWFDRVSDVVSLEPEVMSRSVTAAWETAKYVLAHDTRDARIADRPDDYYAITPTPESVDSLNRFRSKTSLAPQYAVVHPCAADPHKNWPAERFARVADFLIKTRGWDIVVTGTELDRTVAERLRSLTTNPGRVHLAVGEFAFLDLAALLAQAQLMVTVDTASMHLADMVGTPLLALFLPWPRYVRYLPFRQSQSVVVAPNTPADEPPLTDTTRYIDGISVERVLEALDQRLADRSLS